MRFVGQPSTGRLQFQPLKVEQPAADVTAVVGCDSQCQQREQITCEKGKVMSYSQHFSRSGNGRYRKRCHQRLTFSLKFRLKRFHLQKCAGGKEFMSSCFRPKRSCADHQSVLSEVLGGRKAEGKDSFVLFVDTYKAFPTVWLDGLFQKLWDNNNQ
jgi:hypothetical protein